MLDTVSPPPYSYASLSLRKLTPPLRRRADARLRSRLALAHTRAVLGSFRRRLSPCSRRGFRAVPRAETPSSSYRHHHRRCRLARHRHPAATVMSNHTTTHAHILAQSRFGVGYPMDRMKPTWGDLVAAAELRNGDDDHPTVAVANAVGLARFARQHSGPKDKLSKSSRVLGINETEEAAQRRKSTQALGLEAIGSSSRELHIMEHTDSSEVSLDGSIENREVDFRLFRSDTPHVHLEVLSSSCASSSCAESREDAVARHHASYTNNSPDAKKRVRRKWCIFNCLFNRPVKQ